MMHTFHIPVMGIAFTIDTPLKVAHLGIDSAVSIMEDELLEDVRRVYAEKNALPFYPISKKEDDFKAKRVTAFLNQMDDLVQQKFAAFKSSCTLAEAKDYVDLLPEKSELKTTFYQLLAQEGGEVIAIRLIRERAELGSVDVNIMTKVDKVNYKNGQKLDRIYNDAHASLRGFAKSKLRSSLILSAGFNPALYTYMATFSDFYPNSLGHFKKRIVLKVSDYRSALIQSKFLAKKGLWVSEFRVESGLNCGGHAFATEGFLMGPILEEFKSNKNELIQSVLPLYSDALKEAGRIFPEVNPPIKITAQGGVGTAEEHDFLLNRYQLDAIGWGSPFLLVPEVSCLDEDSRELLKNARKEDLYLSEISPLGVPFNNIKNNTKDLEKELAIQKGKAGSPCVKKYLSFNTEFGEKAICTASRKYQSKKIKEINSTELSESKKQEAIDKVTEKACICTGLGTSFLLNEGISTYKVGDGVSLCPGPNMAYFDRQLTLKQMIAHIYGRENVLSQEERPHVFIKELSLYVDYFKNKLNELKRSEKSPSLSSLYQFKNNLLEGISYYKNLFNEVLNNESQELNLLLSQLFDAEKELKKEALIIS
ncbi:MAG: hypothetical protein CMC96_11830 [Flavobacteriales bacterium]|nr:hypothetical protein [Flavobacteriales bacterium]|tara:strand:- start:3851 stop:5629 length:1779 start_codon:yes stop_codon:yes gene_type:complete